MRIAHIITRLIIGGAQENTLYSCEDLIREYGDDVRLLTGPTLGPEGTLMDRVDNRNTPCDLIPSLRRAINPVHDIQAYHHIKRLLREFRPDVVHTHSAKAGILGRMAARSLGVPAIIHGVHGAPFHPYQSTPVREIYRQCERYAASRCDAFISVADAMTDLMVDGGVAPRKKFVTIYSGMEVEPLLESAKYRDAVRQEFSLEPHHIVVGKIARLFHLKGHEYLIEAARQVIDREPNVRFMLVGDGLLTDQHKQRIEQLGLTDYFRFTGLVPPVRIPEMISAMDIAVHTSLREGLARVLPQALISGIPAISYDVDGAREVVINNETGCLLPPKSVEPLAEAICRLAADADLRKKFGTEGQRRFTDQFRHETMTRQIRELYQKVLDGQF